MFSGGLFDIPKRLALLQTLEATMAEPLFWDDQEAAQKTISEANEIKSWTEPYLESKEKIELVEMLSQDRDFCELHANELEKNLEEAEKSLRELELRRMLSGPFDAKNCYFQISAGTGGTEACDWVAMLARMYERWFALRKWQVQVIDELPGEVAGIKNITYKVIGPFAYGNCRAEMGVHRLVRISPFDSNAKRHTSFASVDVTPEIEDSIEIEVRSDDLKVDTYRASGAGGQHVNKTESAVRITHLPSGIVVACQSERSQIQNRETCLKMLKSKLYEREVDARKNKLTQLAGEKREITWGSQIRSYVFQPYTLVKDHRTDYEKGNVQAVMDGQIDEFVEAYLKQSGS